MGGVEGPLFRGTCGGLEQLELLLHPRKDHFLPLSNVKALQDGLPMLNGHVDVGRHNVRQVARRLNPQKEFPCRSGNLWQRLQEFQRDPAHLMKGCSAA